MYLLPLALLVLPLLAGRYPGEVAVARRIPPSRRPVRPRTVVVSSPLRSRLINVPRGGLLVACAMAVRPPPAALASR
jgi:hypothetical protein